MDSGLKSLRTAFFTILFIFVFLFIYTKFFGPIPFSVNSVTTNKNDFLNVDGVGEESAIPDTAEFSAGITKTASTVKDAQDQANIVIKKITDDLKKLGVEEKNIKTTNYSINPNYEYSPQGKSTTNGYTITANLQIKVKPIEKANEAIDTITSDGANLVNNITFTLDKSVRKDLEKKARIKAIEMAKEKAKEITKAAGVKLGKIVNVSENSTQPFLMTADARSLEGVPDQKTTDLQPGENTIKINVTLSYQTY